LGDLRVWPWLRLAREQELLYSGVGSLSKSFEGLLYRLLACLVEGSFLAGGLFDSTQMLACVELVAFRRLVLEMGGCSIMPTSMIWELIIQPSPSLKSSFCASM